MAIRWKLSNLSKMTAQFSCTGDWVFYLEGDEVLHKKDLNTIQNTMEKHLDNPEVEALYFDYYHFYGKPNQVGIAGYKRAPRIIRNTIRNYSPDGLFFVVMDKNKNGGKLIVTTPNGNSLSHQRYGEYWRGLEPPRHIQIFTPNSLYNVVKQAGFSTRVVKTLSIGAAGIYKVSALASKKNHSL